MKRFLALCIVLVCSTAAFGQYTTSDINYDNVSNPNMLLELLIDLFNNYSGTSVLFSPQTSAPTAAEGKVYYNNSANALYLYTGSAWTVVDAGSGTALGSAYTLGSKIDADTDVVEIEVANAANNVALLLDMDDSDNGPDVIQITNAGAGDAISITGASTGRLFYDENGTFAISSVGLVTTSGGFTITAADCLFDDTYDVFWDTSRDQFTFLDNANLGFGGAANDAADVTFKWDASNLLIEAVTDNTGQIRLGSTNSMDFAVYGSTNSNTVLFDVSGSLLTTNGWKVNLQDDDDLTFGDSDEFTIEYDEDSTDNLLIVALNADDAVQIGDGTTRTDFILQSTGDAEAQVQFDASGDTANGQMLFGADDHGIDVVFYGATASQKAWWDQSGDTWYYGADAEGVDVYFYGDTTANTVLWDESQDRMEWTAADIFLDDNSDLIIGSDSDFVIDSDTTKTLDILPGAATDDYIVNFGLNQSGVDIKAFGATTGEYFSWDASADSILANCGNTLLTQTDAEANQFKVDAVGTVAGVAIQLETTDGGISILADGATNGDIAIDAEDDITITAAGDLTLAVTGTVKGGGAKIDNVMMTVEVVAGTTDVLTAAQSGQTLIYTMTGGACTVTLPEATSATVGVYFWLLDGNATATNDLSVDPEGTGTINGDAAGNYIKNETDADGCAVMLVCTAADTWYAVYTTAAWTEE